MTSCFWMPNRGNKTHQRCNWTCEWRESRRRAVEVAPRPGGGRAAPQTPTSPPEAPFVLGPQWAWCPHRSRGHDAVTTLRHRSHLAQSSLLYLARCYFPKIADSETDFFLGSHTKNCGSFYFPRADSFLPPSIRGSCRSARLSSPIRRRVCDAPGTRLTPQHPAAPWVKHLRAQDCFYELMHSMQMWQTHNTF